MAVQGWIVAGAFLAIIALVVTRVIMLRRRGIQAFLFGVSHRSDATLPPLILLILYCLTTPATGWPMWPPLIQPFWTTDIPGWFGVALCLVAVAGLAWTLVSFGDSFRVGIDQERPSGLVTSGAFARSRNPIYVNFDGFVIGLFLTQHNLVATIVLVVFVLLVHRQVLREEQFLAGHYGQEFEDYRHRVRRYL